MKTVIASLTICFAFAIELYAGDGRIHRAAEPVANRYLVQLNTSAAHDVLTISHQLGSLVGANVDYVFQYANIGFSATMNEQQANVLARHPSVEFVEEVALAHPSRDQQLPVDNSLYNLDRIDQTDINYDHHYYYCERGGGVTIYIVGLGVNKKHSQFLRTDGTSRVVNGVKYADDTWIWPGESADYGTLPCGQYIDGFTGNPNVIPNGAHDTSVASIAAGNDLGVAKNATIVPVRVGNCAGTQQTDWIAFGLDWIMSPQNPYRGQRPAVVNMSFGVFTKDCNLQDLSAPTFMENEINNLLGYDYDASTQVCSTPHIVAGDGYSWSGIAVVVSANNQNSSASYTSPARMSYTNAAAFHTCGHVVSVGGSDELDHRWVCDPSVETCSSQNTYCGPLSVGGSNYGPTVDIYAPAHNIRSASIASATSERTGPSRSGTSWAAPLVTGVVARMLEVGWWYAPDDVWAQLQASASHALQAIDPITGNTMIVHRTGYPACTPEYQ